MPSFDLIQEFGISDPMAGEAICVDPYWIIVVMRTQYPLTYSRVAQTSFSRLYEDAVRLRGKPLIITDSCVQISTSNSKNSHLTNLEASLLPDDRLNYMSEILPGDWVFAWMMNDRATFDRVLKNLNEGKPCNGFYDGLKFMGRVGGVRKLLAQDPSSGIRRVSYSLNAAGFTEFDATLFYEPHLAERIKNLGEYWARITGQLNKMIDQNTQGIGVTDAMLFFLDTLLGQGIPRNLGRGNDDPRLRATTGLDAPYAYIVPASVGSIIGKTDKSKPGGLLSAADLLEFVYGVQNYAELEISDDQRQLMGEEGADASIVQAGQIFNPVGTRAGGSRRWTGVDLLGVFLPTIPQFTNKSVWTVLSQYLNPAANEMYTCLRVNPLGQVVPTLVVRQLPFSSEKAPSDLPTTKYLELPRWKLHPHLVKRADVGRSDSLRMNFIHVYGDPGPIKNDIASRQIVAYPPIRDDLDIARSGLHPYQMTVQCAEKDILTGGPQKWMALLGDILMGQHLTLTGIIELVGIKSPICPGDNVEWDGVVFHVESVSHTCAITPAGFKSFSTTLSVSHGLSAEPSSDELSLYPGLAQDSMRAFEPGLTVEGEVLNEPTESKMGTPEDPTAGAQVNAALAGTYTGLP